jgi:hypothetical protein
VAGRIWTDVKAMALFKNYIEEAASPTKYITHNVVSIQNATRILVE